MLQDSRAPSVKQTSTSVLGRAARVEEAVKTESTRSLANVMVDGAGRLAKTTTTIVQAKTAGMASAVTVLRPIRAIVMPDGLVMNVRATLMIALALIAVVAAVLMVLIPSPARAILASMAIVAR